MRRIGPFDVERRIGLGKALGLGFCQHVGKVPPGIFHGREDEIAGAVEDAVDPLDLVRSSPFAQALDDGNPASDRRFELQRDFLFLGLAGEFQAVVRDHRLVRGDQGLARFDRGAGQGKGRAIGPADHLDHHVHILALAQDDHVVFPGIGGQVHTARLVAITRRNDRDLDRPTGPARNQLGIRLDQADHADPDGSQSSKRNLQRFGHVRSLSPRALRRGRHGGQGRE